MNHLCLNEESAKLFAEECCGEEYYLAKELMGFLELNTYNPQITSKVDNGYIYIDPVTKKLVKARSSKWPKPQKSDAVISLANEAISVQAGGFNNAYMIVLTVEQIIIWHTYTSDEIYFIVKIPKKYQRNILSVAEIEKPNIYYDDDPNLYSFKLGIYLSGFSNMVLKIQVVYNEKKTTVLCIDDIEPSYPDKIPYETKPAVLSAMYIYDEPYITTPIISPTYIYDGSLLIILSVDPFFGINVTRGPPQIASLRTDHELQTDTTLLDCHKRNYIKWIYNTGLKNIKEYRVIASYMGNFLVLVLFLDGSLKLYVIDVKGSDPLAITRWLKDNYDITKDYSEICVSNKILYNADYEYDVTVGFVEILLPDECNSEIAFIEQRKFEIGGLSYNSRNITYYTDFLIVSKKGAAYMLVAKCEKNKLVLKCEENKN
jgi:hypothetical protein